MFKIYAMTPLKWAALLLTVALLGGCSDYHYKNYQGDWAPEQLKPYDLSDNASEAALVYFDTIRYRALGVPFHRLLLATDVDGLRIKGAGRRSILDVSGEQALKLKPGKHSLRWCWLSMNALGTGGAMCNFAAADVEFRPGQRYVVTFQTDENIKGPPGRQELEIKVQSSIKNLDTKEVIFPPATMAQTE
ncbi:hypothetical protein [Pseudomonas sp. MWU13-2105]|uniref:hypothetical protein n=1 Tax=Pseudomonas sp. MWU13-2105 TaxID=2935074 RepID=UPI00200C857F|nr:hypothetical protein [Pseudomonas sp. MWU13-2105]